MGNMITPLIQEDMGTGISKLIVLSFFFLNKLCNQKLLTTALVLGLA